MKGNIYAYSWAWSSWGVFFLYDSLRFQHDSIFDFRTEHLPKINLEDTDQNIVLFFFNLITCYYPYVGCSQTYISLWGFVCLGPIERRDDECKVIGVFNSSFFCEDMCILSLCWWYCELPRWNFHRGRHFTSKVSYFVFVASNVSEDWFFSSKCKLTLLEDWCSDSASTSTTTFTATSTSIL